MGKWIKQGGVSVQVKRPGREKWTCDFGVEHFSEKGSCMCADAQVDDPFDGRDPRGFVQVRHTKRKKGREGTGRKTYAYAMTKDEARRHHGITPPKRSRKKPPPPNAPMWLMDNEQRRRAASRMRSL